MSPVEQRASLWAQYALYVLLFVTTVIGWAGTNAYGDPVSVFGLFDFPAIIEKDQPLSDRIFVWHLICGILIGVIVALHITAALYHWLVKRDSVLQRMLPRRSDLEWTPSNRGTPTAAYPPRHALLPSAGGFPMS